MNILFNWIIFSLGIFISSLPNELKAFGNSFSTTLITLFGQLPAPYLYGAIYNIDKTKKTAFNLTLFYSWFGVLFILIGTIFRIDICKFKKIKDNLEKNKNKNENEGEIKREENILDDLNSSQINNKVKKYIEIKIT